MTAVENTQPGFKPSGESGRLAEQYLAVGLGELEMTILRETNAGHPQPLALIDAAGNVAQALQWLKEWLYGSEDPNS